MKLHHLENTRLIYSNKTYAKHSGKLWKCRENEEQDFSTKKVGNEKSSKYHSGNGKHGNWGNTNHNTCTDGNKIPQCMPWLTSKKFAKKILTFTYCLQNYPPYYSKISPPIINLF